MGRGNVPSRAHKMATSIKGGWGVVGWQGISYVASDEIISATSNEKMNFASDRLTGKEGCGTSLRNDASDHAKEVQAK